MTNPQPPWYGKRPCGLPPLSPGWLARILFPAARPIDRRRARNRDELALAFLVAVPFLVFWALWFFMGWLL